MPVVRSRSVVPFLALARFLIPTHCVAGCLSTTGGTAISENLVLTAAHCVANSDWLDAAAGGFGVRI
jgi:V8-like Glu-specific endopeptidase